MDACNSMSVLLYRMSKPLGKVRRRVQDLRIPSSTYTGGGFKLDLSHNESHRFAVDSLLCQGLEGYQEVLKAEREADFLSELEKDYILQNWSDPTKDDGGKTDKDKEFENSSAASISVESLDHDTDGKLAAPVSADPSTEVFFQSDSSAAGMKDLVRQFLRKAKLALAIVMDSFSDPELLCDLLEASRKRNVSVYLLLDHRNLKVFVDMWKDLKLISKNFPKVSVRSVPGKTYCAKSGRKLRGQISESFIIADWDEVLTGTYSFTWLSGQVHQSLLVLIKGRSVSHFHQEFLRLNSSSKPAPDFVTFISLPQSLCLFSTTHKPHNTVSCEWKPHQTAAACPPSHVELHLRSPQQDKQPGEKNNSDIHTVRKALELPLKPLVQTGAVYKMQNVAVGKPQHTLEADCTQQGERAKVEELGRKQNQIHTHPNLSDQTSSDVQSQLHSSSVNITAQRNVELQGPDTRSVISQKDGGHRNVHYQSALKKNSHPDGSTEGGSSQQKNRSMLIEPAGSTRGMKAQRNQQDSSPNLYPKVDLPCDQPKLLGSQQIQPETSCQIPSGSPRENVSKFQPSISSRRTTKQDEFMKQNRGPLNSPSFLTPAPAGIGTCFRPQQQADYQSGVRTKTHLSPGTYQQVNLSQRLHWSPQKAVGPRVIARYNSFSGAHVMGQASWRPLQNSRNTSLGRSLSMNDRCTAGYRHHLN